MKDKIIDWNKPIAYTRNGSFDSPLDLVAGPDRSSMRIVKSKWNNFLFATHDGRLYDILGMIEDIRVINVDNPNTTN